MKTKVRVLNISVKELKAINKGLEGINHLLEKRKIDVADIISIESVVDAIGRSVTRIWYRKYVPEKEDSFVFDDATAGRLAEIEKEIAELDRKMEQIEKGNE